MTEPTTTERESWLVHALATAAFATLAISDPIMQMINASPDFYAIYSFSSGEKLLVIAVLVVFIPLLFAALSLHRGLRSVVLPACMALIFAQLLPDTASEAGTLVLCAVAIAAGVLAYRHLYLDTRAVRLVSACCSAFVPWLLIQSIAAADLQTGRPSDQAAPAEALAQADHNVLLIVLDELPTSTLMNAAGEIDPILFPEFSRLSNTATWYRGASSVSCNTASAVPAILTGANPPAASQGAGANTSNLFELLAPTHTVRALEPVTAICPSTICATGQARRGKESWLLLLEHLAVAYARAVMPAPLTNRLPALEPYWIEAGTLHAQTGASDHTVSYDHRAQSFQSFTSGLRSLPAPWATFTHILLPHSPFIYTAGGRHYFKGGATYAIADGSWIGPEAHIHQNHYRHIEQARFTDRLLGGLWRTLEADGLFDQTMIIVVADHGVNFELGEARRTTTADNIANLIGVPLFVKRPYQRQGGIDDRLALTTDILPTIMAELGAKAVPNMDGRSLNEPGAPDRNRIHVCSTSAQYDINLLEEQRTAVSKRQEQVLSADRRPAFYVKPDWLGQTIRALGSEIDSRSSAYLAGFDPEAQTEESATHTPLHLNGTLRADPAVPAEEILIVVSINGVVNAVMPIIEIGESQVISILLDQSGFVEGENTLEMHWTDGGETFRKVLLSSAVRSGGYAWTFEH